VNNKIRYPVYVSAQYVVVLRTETGSHKIMRIPQISRTPLIFIIRLFYTSSCLAIKCFEPSVRAVFLFLAPCDVSLRTWRCYLSFYRHFNTSSFAALIAMYECKCSKEDVLSFWDAVNIIMGGRDDILTSLNQYRTIRFC
jgi:hypothetical protein